MNSLVRWGFVGALIVTGCGARTLAGDDTEGVVPVGTPIGGGADASRSGEDATVADEADNPPVDDAASPFFVCPPRFPALGTACDTDGQVCAYVGPGSLCQAFECGTVHNAPPLVWQSTKLGC
jgi:hypothetical protein